MPSAEGWCCGGVDHKGCRGGDYCSRGGPSYGSCSGLCCLAGPSRPGCSRWRDHLCALIFVATASCWWACGGVGGTYALWCKTELTDLESLSLSSLNLSFTWNHIAKKARSCSISPTPKGHLRPAFTTTLPTLSVLQSTPKWQPGHNSDDKCPT